MMSSSYLEPYLTQSELSSLGFPTTFKLSSITWSSFCIKKTLDTSTYYFLKNFLPGKNPVELGFSPRLNFSPLVPR